jgi:hypothetical protein
LHSPTPRYAHFGQLSFSSVQLPSEWYTIWAKVEEKEGIPLSWFH